MFDPAAAAERPAKPRVKPFRDHDEPPEDTPERRRSPPSHGDPKPPGS